MTRQIEIETDMVVKWFGVKNKWPLGASGWTGCRATVQSGWLTQEHHSLPRYSPCKECSLLTCRLYNVECAFQPYQQLVSSVWQEKRHQKVYEIAPCCYDDNNSAWSIWR